VKKRRINWGEGAEKVKLDTAIKEWEGGGRCAPDRSGGPLSLRGFSGLCNIPYETFKKYVAKDSNKRRVCGESVGRAPLLGKEDQRFLVEVMARKDPANDGANPSEAIDLLQELAPSLSREQSRRHLKRTLIPHHPEQVKRKPVVAQATTTKRSAVTLAQKFRWHVTYEGALNELRERNTGKCRLSGKTFGELIQYFISGGDETCFMASLIHGL
jgi:hypothetical protein